MLVLQQEVLRLEVLEQNSAAAAVGLACWAGVLVCCWPIRGARVRACATTGLYQRRGRGMMGQCSRLESCSESDAWRKMGECKKCVVLGQLMERLTACSTTTKQVAGPALPLRT